MTASQKIWNPFYVLLAPVGVLFFLTAFGYGVLAFQAVHPVGPGDWPSTAGGAEHPWVHWLRLRGEAALLAELAVLGVLTVGSIMYESYRERPQRSDARSSGDP